MTARLILRDLWIRGPAGWLVRRVSLTARAGKVTGLVGPSGSGKSLSMRAAMGLCDVLPGIEAGELRYPGVHDDDLLAGVRGAGRRGAQRLLQRTAELRGCWVTVAPQVASSALNPGRTLGAQLAAAMKRGGEVDPKRARRLLDEVGLPSAATKALPHELSGGMAQRAALAVALAPRPRVLIADEPETGLDPVLRRTVLELLLRMGRDHEVALVLITHDADALARSADDVVDLGAAA